MKALRAAYLFAALAGLQAAFGGMAAAEPPAQTEATSPQEPAAQGKVTTLYQGFGLRKLMFVTASVAGFGDYKKRAARVFAPGEPMHFYCEPVNFGWAHTGEIARFRVLMDFEIRKPDGEIIKKGFGQVGWDSVQIPPDTFMAGAIRIPNAAASGPYVLGLRWRDLANNRIIERDLPFEIAKPRGSDA
jgi:hypothetical protein